MSRLFSLMMGASLLVGAARAEEDPLASAQRELSSRSSAPAAIAEPPAVPAAPEAPPAFSPRFDSAVPESLRAQLLGDILFAQSLHGETSSPLHLQVFGSVDGSNYLAYLNERIKKVGVGDAGGDPTVLAYAHGLFNRRKMWFTPSYLKGDYPGIRRVEILIHEARHTEREGWPHERCPDPFKDEQGQDVRTSSGYLLAGSDACDDTPIGAYGVGIIMLKNVEKFCESCAPKVRMDAKLYADKEFKRIVGPAARQALRDDLFR